MFIFCITSRKGVGKLINIAEAIQQVAMENPQAANILVDKNGIILYASETYQK